ncbi:MAG: hypothetical protein GOVbin556_73 [Prokaryotic dsDNA virus sp.]|nr:MAG: hypothetical protein GOVbin556_73 [Prokaryotic dsDNA virus sp.]|tara:strand:- start:12282 stop:12587 length:306 start_codon:yes stop_codon:yes gene_type:complete
MSWKDEIKKKEQKDGEYDEYTSSKNKVGRATVFLNKEKQGQNIEEYITKIEKKVSALLKDLDKYEGRDVADGSIPNDIISKINLLGEIELNLLTLSNGLGE